MAHVAVLGAGVGGTIMAYEPPDALGASYKMRVTRQGS